VLATSSVGLNSPHGLAFDSAGNLFVANYGAGNILEYSASGTWSIYVSGLTNPTSIAIYPGLKIWSATPLILSQPTMATGGVLQFGFTASAGLSFNAVAKTNLSQNWMVTNPVVEMSPGLYQFSDPQTTNSPQRFYRVRTP
jgi:hypothetical protein